MGIFAQYVPARLVLLGAAELMLSFLLFYATLRSPGLTPPSGADAFRMALTLAVAIVAATTTIGLYQPHTWLDRRLLIRNAGAAGMVALPVVLVIAGGFTQASQTSLIVLLAAVLGGWMIIALAIRLLAGPVAARLAFTRRVMILGDGPAAERVRHQLRSRRGRLFDIVSASADADADTLSLGALRRQNIWGIITATDIAADQGRPAVVARLLDSKLRGIRVLDVATFQERYLGRLDLNMIGPTWMLYADGFHGGRVAATLKRLLDVVGSLTLLALALPVMLLTALLIRLDSPGPVLYRQERTGLHGVPFTLLKFRSMRADAEANGTPRWAQARDPRITRVGAFIRMTRIDELPQLLNVLLGEMSLVGPRPERPHFVRQLERSISLYHERTYVKPGITGWAQVNYPYGASVADAREKLSYDLYYVKNRGLLVDILILAATVRVVLFREGAR
jgi:sugar transferase (PEP-CTERM system associated)